MSENNNNHDPNFIDINSYDGNLDQTTIPLDLDLNNFIPKKEEQSSIIEKNDIPIIEEVQKQNNQFCQILQSRIGKLKTINTVWNNNYNKSEAFGVMGELNDLGLSNDVLNYAFIQTELKKIDIRSDDLLILFPSIIKMINSKYDIYFKNGCLAAWNILKLYYNIIIQTKESIYYSPKGIDLNKEEKIKKYNIIIDYFHQLKNLPNIDEHLKKEGQIEGLDLKKFISEVDYFVKKCRNL
jgi:hypothetical protein